MAEKFIVLMADWDDKTQKVLSGWYEELRKQGFVGNQTPNLPYHISLVTFPLEKENEAVELIKKVAVKTAPASVHLSHIGLFAGGKILFGAPERNVQLDKLHDACDIGIVQEYPWTPHTTILIDEPEVVHSALPTLIKTFHPLVGTISRLHLCAFWPTREIAAFDLTGKE